MNFYFPPDFHFGTPQAFFLCILFIPILYLMWQSWRYKKALDQIFYQNYFDLKKEGRRALWFFLGFSGLVFSLMDPLGYRHIERGSQPSLLMREQPLPLLFLFDTSLSMTTPDASFSKTRFEEGKEIIASFLDQLKPFPKALYVFQDHLQPIIPLTLDEMFMRLTLEGLSPNISSEGTQFLPMLEELRERLAGKEGIKPRQIILISDGEDTSGDLDVVAMQKGVLALVQEGMTFHVIGVGSVEGREIPGITFEDRPVLSYKNEKVLRALAEAGGGQYIDPRKESLASLTQTLAEDIGRHTFSKVYFQASESSYIS